MLIVCVSSTVDYTGNVDATGCSPLLSGKLSEKGLGDPVGFRLSFQRAPLGFGFLWFGSVLGVASLLCLVLLKLKRALRLVNFTHQRIWGGGWGYECW